MRIVLSGWGWLLVVLLWSSLLNGQEIPEVIPFFAEDYGAHAQNWSITQTPNQAVFIANSSGVLRFNGFEWQLIPFIDGRRVRAVQVGKDNKIYCGGYRSFGYLEENQYRWTYQPMSDSLIGERMEEIWHIFATSDRILFQSFAEIYDFDYNSLRLVSPPDNIMFGDKIGEQILFPRIRGGILVYQPLGDPLFTGIIDFPDEAKITGMADFGEKGILVATQSRGLFWWKNNQISSFRHDLQIRLKSDQINRMLRLSDGHLVIGTIQDGIYILTDELKIAYHINREKGLTNNTVLSLFEDATGDLWVGTDNGINLVKWSSPNRYFYDRNDAIGNIFVSVELDSQLFLGTNKGLFVKKGTVPFQNISPIKGQVWSFLQDGKTLLIGHNEGTSALSGQRVTKVSDITGGLKMTLLSPRQVLQSTYTGWILLKKENEQWQFDQRIAGSSLSFTNYELEDTTVYGFNRNEGIIRQVFSDDFTEVLLSQPVTGEEIISNLEELQFYKQNDSICFCIPKKCFRIDGNRYYALSPVESVKIQNQLLRLASIVPFAGGYYRPDALKDAPLDSVFLDYIVVNGQKKKPTKKKLQLKYRQNTLEIQLARHSFERSASNYQYQIVSGSSGHWLNLPENGKIQLQDLQAKSYSISVRHPSGKEQTLMDFEIMTPWYKSWLGWLLYFLIIAGSVYGIAVYQNRQMRLANEQLLKEKEQELEKARFIAKNNELEREINHKSQLLANSAMTLVQKNKMLNELKEVVEENLKSDKERNTRQQIVRMIDRNINSDEDWQIFEDNFNQVHQEFMERLRSEFEGLTPSELKLAAYIRMGLLSKEIAPLLNISSRSVENKRSLLRKKLNLDSGDNLKEFITNY